MTDKIPPALRTAIEGKGHTIKSFSLLLDYGENWIYQLFEGNSALTRYERLADFTGLSLDELVEIITAAQVSAWFAQMKKDGIFTSTYDLAKKISVSKGFLNSLAEDSGKLNGIYPYVLLAEKAGIELEKLRRHPPSAKLSA
jgi:hypothetical protein